MQCINTFSMNLLHMNNAFLLFSMTCFLSIVYMIFVTSYEIFLMSLFLTSSNKEFCSTEKKIIIMLIFTKSAIKSHIYVPLNLPELR